jgi:hypothetical protein
MDPAHTKVVNFEETPLRKMEISYLLSNEPGMKGTIDYVAASAGRNNMDPCTQQQGIQITATRCLGPGSASDRVERWVTSQLPAHITDSDTGHAADNEDVTTTSQRQLTQTQRNEHASAALPVTEVALPDYQIVLADTELIRLRDFTSPTPKRHRPQQLGCTCDEKLFIMHARVIGNLSWQDISSIFQHIFVKKDTRHTVSYLRSIYYRTRRDWGMDYVTRGGPMQRQSDETIVSMKLKEHAGEFDTSRAVFRM